MSIIYYIYDYHNICKRKSTLAIALCRASGLPGSKDLTVISKAANGNPYIPTIYIHIYTVIL